MFVNLVLGMTDQIMATNDKKPSFPGGIQAGMAFVVIAVQKECS